MAIKVPFTKKIVYTSADGDIMSHDRTYPEAYCRICSYNGVKKQARYDVEVFVDATTKELIQRISYEFAPSVETDSGNILKQAYNHLKTRPQFAGGEDC